MEIPKTAFGSILIPCEKRDSNPQPSPWQGNTLPIEILPLKAS
jgi:hypothetical protein